MTITYQILNLALLQHHTRSCTTYPRVSRSLRGRLFVDDSALKTDRTAEMQSSTEQGLLTQHTSEKFLL